MNATATTYDDEIIRHRHLEAARAIDQVEQIASLLNLTPDTEDDIERLRETFDEAWKLHNGN